MPEGNQGGDQPSPGKLPRNREDKVSNPRMNLSSNVLAIAIEAIFNSSIVL